MTETNVQENKMGVVPVPKLLFQMSLPMILHHAGAGFIQRGGQCFRGTDQ